MLFFILVDVVLLLWWIDGGMFWVWVLCGVLLGVYVWCVGDDV